MFQKVTVIVGLNWISFLNGFLFGQIASMTNSLQKNEERLDFSESQISLIVSTTIMTLLVGYGLAAAATDKLGRRWPYVLFSITTVISLVILHHAQEMHQFLISRILAGISMGALMTLNIFVPSEYTSPKTRAFFLNMITTVAPAIGSTFVHAIGIFMHWRTIVLVGIFPAAVGVVLPYFWVESPHWLASKGKFDECQTTFRQLHGKSPNSEKELKMLIKMEESKLEAAREINCKPTLKRLLAVFRRRYFWKVFTMSIIIQAYLAATAKLVFTTLATVILEEITGTSDVFLFTLLIDAFIVFGSCMSCLLIRKTSVRTLLFSTGITANAILIIFSGCYYLKNGQNYFNWINVVLLALYFIIINAGPLPLLEAICSEMFPLELKLYIFFLSGFILIGAGTLSIISLPYLISAIGYHGLFLLNAAIMSLSLGYIWLMFPETKGRTLQEVELYFKTRRFDVDEVLSNEHLKELI